jgi:hypothetical protein
MSSDPKQSKRKLRKGRKEVCPSSLSQQKFATLDWCKKKRGEGEEGGKGGTGPNSQREFI